MALISNFLNNNKLAQRGLRFTKNNPVVVDSLVSTATVTTIRPLAIKLVPSDKESKKDKDYYIARSFITGAIDTLITLPLFFTLSKILDKNVDKTLMKKGNIFYNNSKLLKDTKGLIKRGLKLAVVPIQSTLLFYAIPKLVDKYRNKKD